MQVILDSPFARLGSTPIWGGGGGGGRKESSGTAQKESKRCPCLDPGSCFPYLAAISSASRL